MFGRRVTRAILASTAICGTCFALPAAAQVAAPAPVRNNIDGNGVDLFLGTMNADGPVLSAGDGDRQGMAWKKVVRGTGNWGDTLVGTLSINGSTALVSFGGVTDRFTGSGSTYTSTEGKGATLTVSGGTYTYTATDGTVAIFTTSYAGIFPFQNIQGNVTKITRPNGVVFSYTYESFSYCSNAKDLDGEQTCTQHNNAYRVASITSNANYRISLNYGNWNPGAVDDNTPYISLPGWNDVTSVGLSNTTITGSPTRTQAFSTTFYSGYHRFSVTDAMGRLTSYKMIPVNSSGARAVGGIQLPGSTTDNVTVTYDSAGRVITITNPAGTTTYAYAPDTGGVRTTTVTDPGGHSTVYTFSIASNRMLSATNPLSKITSWTYDASGRVSKVTAPEGNYTQHTYDNRGNVTETRNVAKSGSGLADIVETAGYDASCTSVVKCNTPNWTKDANLNQTDYTYDPTTGDVLTVKAPAASVGGIRPTVNYSYTTVNGISMVSAISMCQASASCAGTAGETKTTLAYNANGLPTTISKGAGDGSLTATTSIGYDDVGNAISVDGPLPGNADTTTYRYDADRELVGVIAPDPDGAGALKRKAMRTTYNDRGLVTLAELGTVIGATDTDWAAFSSLQQQASSFDANGRKIRVVRTAGGVTYGVSEYSYDAAGRPDCVATRMNTAVWGTPLAACTAASAGANGPDRINRVTLYDELNRPKEVATAYGTAVQSIVKTSFTDNGKTGSLVDSENNKTTYEYDGFDRLLKTRYPSITKGSGTSSLTDYKQFTYDPNGNVTSQRLRDTTSVGYTYDALNRVILMDLSGSGIDQDISYTYDLMGRMTYSLNPWGHRTYYSFDALGRMTGEGTTYGAVKASSYDLAGRRTRLTWPDGFYVDYDYDVTGNMTAVRENGAATGIGVLAVYGYDDLGRRTSLTRGNGVVTSYGYDAASRLTTLTSDLAGSAYDVTTTLSYNAASQITSTTRSNDAYAWTGAATVNRGYTSNGLNQFTASGSTSLGYDARGNLSTSGSDSYSYSQRNQLENYALSSSTGTLYYDPPGRLDLIYGTSTSTTFDYDGDRLATEGLYGGTSVSRRYVFGANTDEPLVWYEGSGTSDRRWLVADERGSIVAVTNASGVATTINTYDEYGIPGSGNAGRFQYTGQAWLSELGMYYYKARMYSPTLGRFMQTDPIGYGDGMNWYNYVGGDPVNWRDPFGLDSCPAGQTWHDSQCWANPDNDIIACGNCENGVTNLFAGLSGAFGGLPGGGFFGGGGGGGIEEYKIESDKPCSAGQRLFQELGKEAVEAGGDLQTLGLGVTGVGLGAAGVGVATLDPALVLGGGVLSEDGLAVTAAGDITAFSGAAIMTLAGSGKEDAKALMTLSLTRRIPEGFLKNIASKIIDKAAEVIIPEVKSCR